MQALAALEPADGGLRFKLGSAIFVLGFALWGLVPLAALMQASAGTIAALTSTVFIGNKDRAVPLRCAVAGDG